MTTKSFSFSTIPPVFKRHHHVLIALFDEENRLYLSRKHVYPANIYRLFGGGVEGDEPSDSAVKRELLEETGISGDPHLQETFSFQILETTTNTSVSITFDLYYLNIHRQRIVPGDDVKGMRIFAQEDMPELLDDMQSLSKTPFIDKDNQSFTWFDWGQVFAVIHQYVYDNWPK